MIVYRKTQTTIIVLTQFNVIFAEFYENAQGGAKNVYIFTTLQLFRKRDRKLKQSSFAMKQLLVPFLHTVYPTK